MPKHSRGKNTMIRNTSLNVMECRIVSPFLGRGGSDYLENGKLNFGSRYDFTTKRGSYLETWQMIRRTDIVVKGTTMHESQDIKTTVPRDEDSTNEPTTPRRAYHAEHGEVPPHLYPGVGSHEGAEIGSSSDTGLSGDDGAARKRTIWAVDEPSFQGRRFATDLRARTWQTRHGEHSNE